MVSMKRAQNNSTFVWLY